MFDLHIINFRVNNFETNYIETNHINDNLEIIKEMGFDIEEFGENSFKISTVPVLFENVNISVAMGNSHPMLIEKSKYTTKDVKENGVYHFLKQYFN